MGDKFYIVGNFFVNFKLGLKGFLFIVNCKLIGKDNVICEYKLIKVYNIVKFFRYR